MPNRAGAADLGTSVHSLAVVEDGAEIGAGVRIGPFCHVGADVVLHDNVELVSHVSVTGATTIGTGTKVFPQAVLGGTPQNTKHKGGRTTLVIGSDCVIREAVTIHVGTDGSRGETTVGNNCMLMAYSHVAHDCVLGDHVTFANGATLGGHVEVSDHVTIGGLAAVHQFVRIGHHAFVGGMSGLAGDLIPYGMAIGNRAKLRGLNVVGLKRSGITRTELGVLRNAYRVLFDRNGTVAENATAAHAEFGSEPHVADVLGFVMNRGKRIFCVPAIAGPGAAENGQDD